MHIVRVLMLTCTMLAPFRLVAGIPQLEDSPPYRMGVSPTRLEVPASPGTTVAGQLTVLNAGVRPIEVRNYVTSFRYDELGNRIWADLDPDQGSCQFWTDISPAQLRLEPDQSTKVDYAVTVPPDALGGYHALMVVHMIPVLPEGVDAGTPVEQEKLREEKDGPRATAQVKLEGRIAVPLYLTAGSEASVDTRGHAEELEVVPPVGNTPLSFALPFVNNGKSHLKARGSVLILDQNDKPLTKLEMGEKTIIPGARGKLAARCEEQLPLGRYKALATIEYGYPDTDNVIVRETGFTIREAAEAADFLVTTSDRGTALVPAVINSGYVPISIGGTVSLFGPDAECIEDFRYGPALLAPGSRVNIETPLKERTSPAGKIAVAATAWDKLRDIEEQLPALLSIRQCSIDPTEPTRLLLNLHNDGDRELGVHGVWRMAPLSTEHEPQQLLPRKLDETRIEPGGDASITIEPLPQKLTSQHAILINLVYHQRPR